MSSLPALYGNPLLPFGCAVLTYAFVVGFTVPSSPLRILGLGVMLYTFWSIYACLQTYKFKHAFYANFLGGSSCSIVLGYIEWALLSRWSFEARGPTSAISGIKPVRQQPHASEDATFWQRFSFGMGSCWDERLTFTPWQVKGVPVSRQGFYTSTITAILVYGLILDVMGLGANNSDNPKNFSYTKVPLFSRFDQLSVEELIIRVIGTCIWWAASYWLLQIIYNLAALVLVSLSLSKPERWAPIFGSIAECWSIRQFWGTFWQQCMRRKFTGITYYVLYSLLGLPQGTYLGRYASLTMVFFWSGFAHVLSDLNNAIPMAESGVFRFYMMQAAGIMVEDAFQYLYRSLKGVSRDKQPPNTLERSVGYLWTFLWLVWTTPSWAYPSMARSPDGPILPFSLLSAVPSARTS